MISIFTLTTALNSGVAMYVLNSCCASAVVRRKSLDLGTRYCMISRTLLVSPSERYCSPITPAGPPERISRLMFVLP